MKTLFTTLLIVITTSLYSQNIEWETNLGGSSIDRATSIQQTTDGGYIVAGWTESTDGDVGGNNGGSDSWIVKLDNIGILTWEINLGGNSFDYTYSIQQTTDGGYIIAQSSSYLYDYYVVKIDSTGNLLWGSNLGGINGVFLTSIQQTTDGGYIVAGNSSSNTGNNGGQDYWIAKLNNIGVLIWETNLGGSGNDWLYSIQQTTDGGYIVAGTSTSNNGDVGGNNGEDDYWIVKLNNIGALVWETNLGGSNYDRAYSVQQTIDGGYIVTGGSSSNDGDISVSNGGWDYWIVKLNTIGSLLWEINLGGSNTDISYSIQQTTDGGYIVAGHSGSTNGDVGGNNGFFDYWIVKLNTTGSLVWETNLGGSDYDEARFIQQTIDGGYIVAGYSHSSDGDVGGNNGSSDFWIVKLEGTLGIEDNTATKISLSPNPTTNIITIANLSQKITKIEIFDLQGRLMLSQNNIINNTIDISNLQTATYLVKIYVGRTVFYKKVIKK